MIPNMNCGDKRKTEYQDIELTDEDEDDDTMECLICSENWTQTGPHRLVSLKCGHLYGEKCILRWIAKSKGPKAHCPHCKHVIKTTDLRIVLSIKLGALDTVEIERVKLDVAAAKTALAERRYQLEKSLLALSMSRRELEKMKRWAQPAIPTKDDNGEIKGDVAPSKPRRILQHFRTEYLSTKDLSTRVMALQWGTKSIFASTKKDNGYGVDLFSLDRQGQVGYLPIHDGAIRDIKCHGDLLLSCGHDKILKLTSTKDQKIVNSITLEAPGWCCSFDSDNLSSSHLLYCGLANTTTLIYDSRHTAKPLHCLQNRQVTGGSPIYSIIPMTVGGKYTIVCGNLSNIFAWRLDSSSTEINDTQCQVVDINYLNDTDFKPYSLTRNDSDGSLLISLRRQNASKHVVGRVTDGMKMDISYYFDHIHQQKRVSKTVHYNEDGQPHICFSSDENGTLCITDGMETISCPIGERIFDLNYFKPGDGNMMAAALTTSKLHLYKFM